MSLAKGTTHPLNPLPRLLILHFAVPNHSLEMLQRLFDCYLAAPNEDELVALEVVGNMHPEVGVICNQRRWHQPEQAHYLAVDRADP